MVLRRAREPRLVGGIARRAGGGADQCCVRTSAARRRARSRAVQCLVERKPVRIRRIEPSVLLRTFALVLLGAPPRFRGPSADLSRLRPARHLVYCCTYAKSRKIGRNVGALG